jgi:hypothetical protein
VNAGNWIELAALVVTILGGGSVGVSKLTRIVVVLETLAEQFKTSNAQQQATAQQVQNHEVRIENHETRLGKGGL